MRVPRLVLALTVVFLLDLLGLGVVAMVGSWAICVGSLVVSVASVGSPSGGWRRLKLSRYIVGGPGVVGVSQAGVLEVLEKPLFHIITLLIDTAVLFVFESFV